MKRGTIFFVMLVGSMAATSPAHAQDDLLRSGFLNIDAGAQPQRQTITASTNFPLYDETATVRDEQRIRNGAAFDVSGGMRIGHNLGAGVGYSQFGRAGTGAVTVSIPNPRVYDNPLIVPMDASDLAHKERAIHGRITYFMPVTDTIDVSISGGPSWIHVAQDLATSVSVPAGTQTASLSTETQSGNALGVNAGVEGNMMFTPTLGLGMFIRYTYGKLDLPAVKAFKVGGLQGGVGLRARF